MKALGVIFLVLIVLIGGVHGYMQIQYETMEPCKAAVKRLEADMSSGGFVDQVKALGLSAGQKISSDRVALELQGKEGLVGCYYIALVGTK